MTATARRPDYLDLPEGWERIGSQGPGPFVTAEVLRGPDGQTLRWDSRDHRKRRAGGPQETRHPGMWWRPDRLAWWIGVLFAIGSLCFALAAVASQWASSSRPALGVVFFVGSIFFTCAAYGQCWEAVNVDHSPMAGSVRRRLRPASWEPRRIDWLAGVIQFAGTLFFNISTFAAMRKGLTTQQADLRVWAPDVFGSICFLVSSQLAFAEVCHRWFAVRWRSLSWRIVALNLAGSAFFGISAAASLIEPSSGEPVASHLANATTALGALGFLTGAVLLIPEAARERAGPG